MKTKQDSTENNWNLVCNATKNPNGQNVNLRRTTTQDVNSLCPRNLIFIRKLDFVSSSRNDLLYFAGNDGLFAIIGDQ